MLFNLAVFCIDLLLAKSIELELHLFWVDSEQDVVSHDGDLGIG